jgi:cytochrome c556
MKCPSQAKVRNRRHCSPWACLIALGCAGLPVASSAAEPLALRGIMKEMGRNMQAVVDGLSREDYALVERAARAIAEHPQPPFGEKMRILSFVGGDAPRFKVFDGETHDNATALANAARSGEGEGAIAAFHKLQSSCLACHQAFRKAFVGHFYGKADVRE